MIENFIDRQLGKIEFFKMSLNNKFSISFSQKKLFITLVSGPQMVVFFAFEAFNYCESRPKM